jgi:hypothetical protein
MKYIFKQIDDISGSKAETTVEFSADYLPTILEHFEMFLRGSGFHPSGILDFVDEDDCVQESNDDEYVEPVYSWMNEGVEFPYPIEQSESAMQWTVDQLMKKPMTTESIAEKCSICGLSSEIMNKVKCWDANCPKGNNAN